MPAAMALTETVKRYVASLKERGCRITSSPGSRKEWYRIYDGEVIVYTALRKGAEDIWIVRCTDSNRIKWSQDPQFPDAIKSL